MDVSFGVGVSIAGFGSARAVEAQRETNRVLSNGQSGRDVRGRSYSDGAPATGPSELVLEEQKFASQALSLEQQKAIVLSARARAGGGAALGEVSVTPLYGADGRLGARSTDDNRALEKVAQTAAVATTVSALAQGLDTTVAPPVEPAYSVATPARVSPAEAVRPVRELPSVPRPVEAAAKAVRLGDLDADSGIRQPRPVEETRFQPESVRRAETGAEVVPRRPTEGQSDVMRQRLAQAYQTVPQATPASISLRA